MIEGWAVFGVGLIVVIAAFAQFVREGRGTPAPIAPTQKPFIGGLYRWNRNPMCLAVAAMIGGQALAFASLGMFWWFLVFLVAVWSFVQLYEQPVLSRTMGPSTPHTASRAGVVAEADALESVLKGPTSGSWVVTLGLDS